jgi:hypothetical protein
MHCYTCIFYFSSHKEIVILIEKQFYFIFIKLKNIKNHFFVSETAKTAYKAMHVSFCCRLFGRGLEPLISKLTPNSRLSWSLLLGIRG